MIQPLGASYIYRQSPFVAEYKKFITAEDCAAMVQLCSRLKFSQGQVRYQDESSVDLLKRVARTHKIENSDNAIFTAMLPRVADWLELPNTQYIEQAIIVHYATDGHFDLHTDMMSNVCSQGRKTNRIATVIVYLNDDFKGGYTVFPTLPVAVNPETGKALLFRYDYDSAEINHLTQHAGGRVTGNKYIMVFFIRDGEYPDELRTIANY